MVLVIHNGSIAGIIGTSEEVLKSEQMIQTLKSSHYTMDNLTLNNGYPIFNWEKEREEAKAK